MYAVIKTGGKQYRVAEGQVIRVERLAPPKGETVQFGDVLLLKKNGENCIVGFILQDMSLTWRSMLWASDGFPEKDITIQTVPI